MRALLAASLLLLTAFAGCTSETPIKTLGSADETTSPTPTPATNQTNATETTQPNAPPTASIDANATNGSAPLAVKFTLAGDDPDGDDLSWTADLDGDGQADETGETLPAELEFTYDAPGNYTAKLQVSDGNATAEDTVAITVLAAGKEDLWVRWDADGVCHAKDAVEAGPLWIHDRAAEGEPFGTGLVEGGGTWIYEESNDIPGLQVGGADEDDAYKACVTPDTLIF